MRVYVVVQQHCAYCSEGDRIVAARSSQAAADELALTLDPPAYVVSCELDGPVVD